MTWFEFPEGAFSDLFQRKAKSPSDEAFALARKWSRLSARLGNIIASREPK